VLCEILRSLSANKINIRRHLARLRTRVGYIIFYVVLSSSCLNTMPLLVLSICLTCHFRVTVSALLSLVGPAHQLLLPLAAFKCDVFWANKFDLIWFEWLGFYATAHLVGRSGIMFRLVRPSVRTCVWVCMRVCVCPGGGIPQLACRRRRPVWLIVQAQW